MWERYQGFILDITEKKRSEDEMRRRNRELNALNAMAVIATQSYRRRSMHALSRLFCRRQSLCCSKTLDTCHTTPLRALWLRQLTS